MWRAFRAFEAIDQPDSAAVYLGHATSPEVAGGSEGARLRTYFPVALREEVVMQPGREYPRLLAPAHRLEREHGHGSAVRRDKALSLIEAQRGGRSGVTESLCQGPGRAVRFRPELPFQHSGMLAKRAS